MDSLNQISNRGRPVNAQARAERMAQILDGARACFIAQGFHGTSISEIRKAAGVSTANIYQYFENKDALILALVEDDLKQELDLISRISRSDMRPAAFHVMFRDAFVGQAAIDAATLRCEVLAEAARNPAVAQLLRETDAKAMRAVAAGLAEAQDKGLIDKAIDAEACSEMIALVFDGLQRKLTFTQMAGEDLLRDFVAFLVRALNIPSPRQD